MALYLKNVMPSPIEEELRKLELEKMIKELKDEDSNLRSELEDLRAMFSYHSEDATNPHGPNITQEQMELKGITSGTEVSIQGWQHDMAFSSTDHDTVAWASGTITLLDGTTYSITGANTDTMSAITYIYLDKGTSTTLLQISTTASNAVGSGKILIAVAQNVASGKKALFQVFGGKALGGFGKLITASDITANTITANEIAVNTITASEIFAGTITGTEITGTTLSGIFANLGSITAGNITLNSTGYIRGGQTGYDTGTGFWLGYDTDKYKLSMGNGSTKAFTYDGTDLALVGGTITGGTIQTSNSGQRIVLDGSTNDILIYGPSGLAGTIDSTAGISLNLKAELLLGFSINSVVVAAAGSTSFQFGVKATPSDAYGSFPSLGDSTHRWSTIYGAAGNFSGNITVGGTVDGVDIAAHDGGAIGSYHTGTISSAMHGSQTGIPNAHHTKYTNANAVSAIENAGTISLSGDLDASSYIGNFDDVMINGSNGLYRLYVNSGDAYVGGNLHISGGSIDIKTQNASIAWNGEACLSVPSSGGISELRTSKDFVPVSNNGYSCGLDAKAWSDIYYYTAHDKCLFLDDIDDLEILRQLKPSKIEDKTGHKKLDLSSLPDWLTNGKKGEKRFRNVGHFIDLLAGSIKQLDNRLNKLEDK